MKHFLNHKTESKTYVSSTGDQASGFLQDIVREIGLSLSKSQQILDEKWIESQREKLRDLIENPELKLPPSAAFVLPEANLDLNLEVKGNHDSEGNFKIETRPHNASTKVNSKTSQSVSSKVSLKFVMVPDETVPDQPEVSLADVPKLQVEEVLVLSTKELEENNAIQSRPKVEATSLDARYLPDSRKWHVTVFDGSEEVALLLFDDTSATFLKPILYLSVNHRIIEDVSVLTSPTIEEVTLLIDNEEKSIHTAGSSGQTVILKGQNLGALVVEETIVKVGNTVIQPNEVSFEEIRFKIPITATSGIIEVSTPEGTDKFSTPLRIKATPLRFVSGTEFGFFNPENKEGSLIKVQGENISKETKLVFSNNAVANMVSSTPILGEFKVPENVSSGQVGFITDTELVTMDQLFYTRPFIKSVSPKEARAKELVRIDGNHFINIQQIRIGDVGFNISTEPTTNPSEVYVIKSTRSLLIEVPENAGDGRLFVKSNQRWWDTHVFFYQVPSISKAPSFLIEGLRAEIRGHGFGKTQEGVFLQFSGTSGAENQQAAYVTKIDNSSAQAVGFGVKKGALFGKLRVIRTDIVDEGNFEKTTTQWRKKIPVFREGTIKNQIKWCAPDWEGVNEAWQLTGALLSSRGVIKCLGSNNLSFLPPLPSTSYFFAELYNVDRLAIRLDPVVSIEDNHSLLLLITGSKIKLEYGDQSTVIESTEVPFEHPVELFENLLVSFYFLGDDFHIQLNDTRYSYDLTDLDDQVATLFHKFKIGSSHKNLSISLNEKAYVSTVVLSEYPTLLLPTFPKWEWDFTLEELEKEDSGFELEELKEYPAESAGTFQLLGSGFTVYATAVINEERCLTKYVSETELEVTIYQGAEKGALYVMDYLNPEKKSKPITFKILKNGEITALSPRSVKAGDSIVLTGSHLTDRGIPKIYLGKFGPLTWLELTNELIEIVAPKLTLINGSIRLQYPDGESIYASDPIDITSLNTYNFLRSSYYASWQVPKDLINPSVLTYGSNAGLSEGIGSVSKKDYARLDDGQLHENVLVLTCPHSEYRYVEGRYEDFYIPKGASLIFKIGFLEEARQTDGVRFSVFLEVADRQIPVITPVFEIYGGEKLTELHATFNHTEDKGTLVIRIEPGSSGFDDHFAIAKAEMTFTHVENGWTWLFGSEKKNISTISGTFKEANPYNMPGARYLAAVWHDNQGAIWVFGGYGNDLNPRTGRMSDLWKFDGENWTWMDGMVGKNGFSQLGVAQREARTPGGRFASAYWQDNDGTFWLFGGHGYHISGRQRVLNDLWKFESEQWTMVAVMKSWKDDSPSGLYGNEGILLDHEDQESSTYFWPLTRSHSGFSYDENREVLWMFGGEYREPDRDFLLADLWAFDGENWELKSGGNTENHEPATVREGPSARSGAAVWTDEDGYVWVFGGFGILAGSPTVLNDLWSFDGSTWQKQYKHEVDISNNTEEAISRPGPRSHASVWKDTTGLIWIFGGEGSNTNKGKAAPLNDLWKLNKTEWTYMGGPIKERDMGNLSAPKIPYPNSWPSARFGANTWMSPAGWLMMYGGKGYAEHPVSGNKSIGQLQQLWQFSPDIDKQ